ncbi:hypothetical protein F4825DRAFT_410362, partial [Nemania diffusa]
MYACTTALFLLPHLCSQCSHSNSTYVDTCITSDLHLCLYHLHRQHSSGTTLLTPTLYDVFARDSILTHLLCIITLTKHPTVGPCQSRVFRMYVTVGMVRQRHNTCY